MFQATDAVCGKCISLLHPVAAGRLCPISPRQQVVQIALFLLYICDHLTRSVSQVTVLCSSFSRLMETGAARYALLTADQRRELIVRLQQVLDRSLRIIDEVKLSLAHLHLDCASELDRLTHE